MASPVKPEHGLCFGLTEVSSDYFYRMVEYHDGEKSAGNEPLRVRSGYVLLDDEREGTVTVFKNLYRCTVTTVGTIWVLVLLKVEFMQG